jgi:hypothetical protein
MKLEKKLQKDLIRSHFDESGKNSRKTGSDLNLMNLANTPEDLNQISFDETDKLRKTAIWRRIGSSQAMMKLANSRRVQSGEGVMAHKQ